MTDVETSPAPDAPAATADEGPSFRVLAQYLRDMSFESPGAPDTLTSLERPAIDMSVELGARPRGDNVFEIELRLSARALRAETVIFHVDVQYCGLFQIGGVPEGMMEQIVLIECPRYLFPYARRIISDVTSDGGFPPFQVEPIDFVALYAARKAQGDAPVQGEA